MNEEVADSPWGHYPIPMSTVVQKPRAKTGRPPKPAGESLHPYGLHLSADKKAKLLVVKAALGVSARDFVEGEIEKSYRRMLKAGRVKPID